MGQYIEFIADHLLIELKYPKVLYYKFLYSNRRSKYIFIFFKIWLTKNPFDFMENISLEGKTNFFENKVSQYKIFGAYNPSERIFRTDENF